MNWLQKISQVEPQVFWHASPGHLVDYIIEEGMLKPNNDLEEDTGQSHAGWAFDDLVGTYGDGVYLATTAEDAIFYAGIRLRNYREKTEEYYNYNDELERLNFFDENLEYLGLFRVYVLDNSKLVLNDRKGKEFKYRGIIPNEPNHEAWFKVIKWISRSRDTDKWRKRIEELYKNDQIQSEITEEPV